MLAFIVVAPTFAMQATHLRVEYLERPLAVASLQPRFSWWVTDPTEGAKQSAYQIQVRKGGQTTWDTGRVASSKQNQIECEALDPATDYEWRVKLWDGKNAEGTWTKWEPFRTKLKKWSAPFIGSPDPSGEPKPSHNGYHSQMTNNEAEEKWVEIDLGSSQPITGVTLFPAEPFDWREKVFGLMFPVSYRIEIDGKVVQDKTNVPMPTGPVELSTPATGRKVRLVVTKLRARDGNNYGLALAEIIISNGNQNLSKGKPATAKDSLENKDWSVKNLTNGDTTSHPVQNLHALPVTQLRKEFNAKRPKRALLYATALGAYEFRLNGQKVGDHMLAPEWTDYHSRVQYQTFDVTKMVQPGPNAIGVLLGDGWYAGRLGMAQALDARGYPRAVYGRNPMFSAELIVEYTDGTADTIKTDGSWKATTGGPIRSSDILDGEVYEANREQVGWDKPKFAGQNWKVAREAVPSPMPAIVPQPNEPIRVTKRLKPISRTEPKPGLQVFDMGQNMVGIARFKFKASGKSTIRYAEMLNEDGTVYTTNLRGAPQIDTFTGDGREQWFEPRFTYHGFRYIQIEGTDKLNEKDVEGLVFHSASPEIATIETSNPMVDRLWQNIVWTTRANLMSVPTDCPQRDERLGWTGDILSFGQTINYIMDMGGFTTKWIQDTRDAQADDGRFPDFAPHPYSKNRHFTGVPGWGDAAVGFAYDLWENTGDTRILADHFEAVKKYLGWVASKNPEFIWKNARHNDYGDWLNGDTLIRDGWPRTGGELPKDVFGTLMWFQSAKQAADMARILGKRDEQTKFQGVADRIAGAFEKEYVSADGKIKGDTQAGYALALHLGVLKPEYQDDAFKHLVAALTRVNDHITTGFHSTLPMMKVLTKNGRGDLAYKLLLNKTFPSWGYTIENGATTIWERWDGYVKGRGFQDPGMNSFNHWALGAVGEWMFESVGGIAVLPPGSPTTYRIAPVVGGDLKNARGVLESAYGKVSCEWKTDGSKVNFTVVVPANTMAQVEIAGMEPKTVGAGTHRFSVSKG